MYFWVLSEKSTRRFLAVCKDKNDKLVHTIVHCNIETTLYDGTKNAYTFLKEFNFMKEVLFMINLESGCNNVFKLFKPDGSEMFIKNTYSSSFLDISNAGSLLVYYYEKD